MGIEQRNVDRDPPTGASCELVAVQLEASTLVGTSCYWYAMDRVDGATVAVAAPTAIDNCTAWACHLALRLHPAAVMFVSTPVVVTGDGATRAGQGADRGLTDALRQRAGDVAFLPKAAVCAILLQLEHRCLLRPPGRRVPTEHAIPQDLGQAKKLGQLSRSCLDEMSTLAPS
ncbi:uncharacterized protein LOC112269946 [Brachypodium distachyon]|nr:uncharacterized protein LOC112269946 [Brachypodium distachyon]|eukprot:XP_024313264.1 uncharacterized protein LOC112269946 [Brachypodium distachyon]